MSTPARGLVLQLFVLRDGDLVASEMFAEGTYLLGGEPDSDVRLEHPSVAPVHLEFREGKVHLSGSGGFHLNGVRVAEAVLSSADDVWLGPFLLKTRIMGRRRTPSTAAGAGKTHRVGGAALALVPEPPPPPAMEFEPAEVEQLLSAPLIAKAEPVALGDAEAEQLLTPLAELAPVRPEVAPLRGLVEPAPEAATAVAAPAIAPVVAPPPVAAPVVAAPVAPIAAAPAAAAPVAAPPPARIPSPPPPPQDDAPSVFSAEVTDPDITDPRISMPVAPPPPAPRPASSPGRPKAPSAPGAAPAKRTSAPGRPSIRTAASAAPGAAADAKPAAAAAEATAIAESILPAVAATAAPAIAEAKPARPASLRAPAPSAAVATVPLAAPGASRGLLHARVFWEDTLLFSSSVAASERPFSTPTDAAALQLYGFAPADLPLVRQAGSLFRVKLPDGARAFQRGARGWTPADPGAGRELLLSAGNPVRLSLARFNLELSAQPAPQRAGGTWLRDLDLRMLALLLLLGLSLAVFLRALPKPLPVAPLEAETIRHVQMTIAEKPKVEKPKPKPRPPEQAPKPAIPLAQVTNLKQANVPLHSLDKIAKATKGLSALLSSLTAAPGAAKKDLLAGLPAVDRGPAPLPSLGGTGASGPVTKGNELLRSGRAGLLAAATGGQGEVRGVPVSVPKRPSRVQGSIDRDAVAKVINDKVSEMRSCYERALLRDPNLGAGKVLLEWTINSQGDVSEVRTKTATLKSAEVVSCLLDLLRTLKFPKPNDGVVIVSYPVLFNSVGY